MSHPWIRCLCPLAFVVLSCGEENSARPILPPDPFVERAISAALAGDLSRLVDGNTTFALSLYARLRDREGNLFLSPYSISTALALIWAGARTETESEMSLVLRFPLGQDSLHAVFGALQDNLQIGAGIGGYRLAIANRLWGELGHAWRPEFRRVTLEHYDAPIEELDFAGRPDESRRTINQWVSERTEGKITELLPPGSIGPATSLVLTNAIYFKGTWQNQFDPRNTAGRPFHVSDSETITAATMFQTARLPAGDFGGHQVLALPFRGRDLSLIVLLPEATGTIREMEERLDATNLAVWLAALRVQEAVVLLPKFCFTSKHELRDHLVALGMPAAFQAGSADFSGMDGTRSFSLSQVYHDAFIKVDEVGAEAAAATGGAPPPGLPFRFTADRPFLFLIYDHVTRSALFLGRVVRPVVETTMEP